MTSTVRSWTADLGLADEVFALALVLVLTTFLTFRTRRGSGRPELLRAAVFGVYLAVLAMVVLCPLPGLSPPPPAFPGASDSPLDSVNFSLDLHGFLGQGLSNQNLQNLLLTVPFGFGLPFVVRWRGRWLTLACTVLPVGLEGSQLIVSLAAGWAYRAVDLNDWVANTAGGLLGLALFTQASWLRARTRDTARTAAAAALAVIAGSVTLWMLGPAEDSPDFANACEGAPPADAAHPLKGWTAFADHELLCLTYPGGSSADPAGSPDTIVIPDEQGGITVLGQTPAQTSRVVVTLPDGRSTDADLHPIEGLNGWLVFATELGPHRPAGPAVTTEPTTATVESFAADGSRIQRVRR